MTFADAMLRFAEDRLLTGAELAALFAGIGVDPSERPEPTQILEALSVKSIPLVAARLAHKADGTRPEFDWTWDALQLIDQVETHHILHGDEPLPIVLRKAAVGLSILADVAAGLIRNRMMPPLVPIVNDLEEVRKFRAFVDKVTDGNLRPDPG